MVRIIIILVFAFIPELLTAIAPPNGLLTATARAGDGVTSLLRRYQLADHSCNFEQFYTLNNLTKNSRLFKDKAYYLPVRTVAFDGKTIRSSLGISDYSKALSIQRYNEAMLKSGLREQSYREDKILWVPHHLLNCNSSIPGRTVDIPTEIPENNPVLKTTPANSGGRIFPVFGQELASTPLKSKALEGIIFYLVSGHGGPDPGAMGKSRGKFLCEDEYAYDVTLRLCRKLIEHGATAYMIVRDPDDGIRQGSYLPCDEDERIWGEKQINTHQLTRLQERADIVNALYAKNQKLGIPQQYAIEIHVDSRSQSEQVDLFFYYQDSNKASESLAEKLHQTIRARYQVHRANGIYHGTVSTRGLFTLRNFLPPTVYIELGNIRNSFDQQRILLESNREAIATWLLEALLK